MAALAAAVVVALATARWTLEITFQEIREPIESRSDVLRSLVAIEGEIDRLRGLAEPTDAFRSDPLADYPSSDTDPSPTLTANSYLAHEQTILRLLGAIDSEQWTGYDGKSSTENLGKNIRFFRITARQYLGIPVPPEIAPADEDPASPASEVNRQRLHPQDSTLPRVSTKLFQIHELLKKMEERVVIDIQDLASSGEVLRRWLQLVLYLALALVLLTGGLGVLLLRRWVVHPVANLRTATERIAAGDFEYRIPVPAARTADATLLGDELVALSGEVNHMAATVKRMQTERVEQERLAAVGEMVQRLAHNLRSPLSGIRGLAEVTRSEASGLGTTGDDVRHLQERIIASVDRFEQWLSDLLNVTRPAQLLTSRVDAPTWLSGLVEAHRPLAQTRGVALQLDQAAGPGSVTVDARHLEHALSAILSNAIEAAAATPVVGGGGNPMVRVVSTLLQDGQSGPTWELKVVDNGPGVPETLRKSIFKPYFTTKPSGNGIGLAVAHQVVRAHGGRIEVESGADGPQRGSDVALNLRGAAFVIRLPLDSRLPAATDVASIGQ